jgi:putative ABC transport system ATP-binding protein
MSIEVKGITKEYKRGSQTFCAVNEVNLSVAQGEFVSIIGRSGSGKSTLLNIIAGLTEPTSGSIEADGKDISLLCDREASYYRNSKIGYISQGQSVLSNLTVLDNVRLPYFFFKRGGNSTESALKLLGRVGIPHLAGAYPRQLSGGELKRVIIARALINSPLYVIADEPTSDLDAQTTAEIMKLFKEITQNGTAVLMVTHELDTVGFGNRVFVMEAGKLSESEYMRSY